MKERKRVTKILFCVENEVYRDYLKAHFRDGDEFFINYDQFAFHVAEDPQGIIILQSDSKEYDFIETCKRLKRMFSDKIKILFLSSDYHVSEYAKSVTDRFLQFPVSRAELTQAINELIDKKRKILLIDDSKLVHKHICPPLIEEGYEVYSAMDGQEGLEMAEKVLPDLIISDIEMPRLNGFETCIAIRRIPKLSEVPIIMSSTLGSVSDQRKGFAAGVDEYITKPVNIPDLINRLDSIFKRSLVGRENILIVEPDITISRNIIKTLVKQGFSPRACYNVNEATKILKKFTYEIIITEIDLPDGNAVDLLNTMKVLPRTKNSILLVLTEKNNQGEIKMMIQAGAKGVIQKPFTQDNLLVNVERSIANQRAELEKAQIEKYVSKASKKIALEKSILSGSGTFNRADHKNATIFFSDIKEFTNRCERYSPAEIVEQINTLFSVMTRVIHSTGGDIDKFIGDACMAFWTEEELDKTSIPALNFLLNIQEEIKKLNENSPVLKNDPIKIRMGLNTGRVILCDIGAADARIDLTMIGDTVNLAARLESAAKQYGLDNLVSEYSIKPHLGQFAARAIDQIKVKGKEKPVEVFEFIGINERIDSKVKNLIVSYERALKEYRLGKFQDALGLFEISLKLEKEAKQLNPSSLMIKRCKELIKSSTKESWDGVWTLSDK